MKLIRFGEPGREKPGLILANGQRIDASAFGEDYNETFLANDGLARLAAWAEKNAATAPAIPAGVRLGAPLQRPSKIVCVGLNYADHAKESGMEIPKEPVLFFKATTAYTGPYDGVTIPRGSVKTDWEVEFAIVVGKRASYVSEADALDYVAGYALHNDYSEREWQLERGGQWVKGKSADTFAPVGPWLATKDEIKDPANLNMWLKVNGKLIQNSNTRQMVFQTAKLVSYISHFMTLLPGDIISTGTPPGVGLGFKPPVYLKPGDVVELGIEGLGEQKQTAVAAL